MHRLALVLMGVVASVGVAAAAPTACSQFTNFSPAQYPEGCFVGPLLFSNIGFTAVSGSVTAPSITSTLVQNGYDYTVDLNPKHNAGTVETIETFTVSLLNGGPAVIIEAGQRNGGDGPTSIRQVACAGTISPAGVCTGILLEDQTASGNQMVSALFTPQSSFNVWRDLSSSSGSTITADSFDFTATPEPVSMGLGLSGLVVIWAGKKLRRSAN